MDTLEMLEIKESDFNSNKEFYVYSTYIKLLKEHINLELKRKLSSFKKKIKNPDYLRYCYAKYCIMDLKELYKEKLKLSRGLQKEIVAIRKKKDEDVNYERIMNAIGDLE